MRDRARLFVLLFAGLLLFGPLLSASTIQSTVPVVSSSADRASGALAVLSWLAGAVVFGAGIKVKDAATIAAKYRTRATAASGDYKSGVETAGADWEAGARAGESNYEQGVQEAIAKKRYGRGIAASGAQKYVENAVKLGSARYAQGVQNAEGAFQRGIGPVLQKLASINLPAKGPKRSQQNRDRQAMVAIELGKMKDGQ